MARKVAVRFSLDVGMYYLDYMHKKVINSKINYPSNATLAMKRDIIYEHVYMAYHDGNLSEKDAATQLYWQKNWKQ